MIIPVERDMPAGSYQRRREHLVMTVTQSAAPRARLRSMRRMPALAGMAALLAAGGGVAVAASSGSNPHSSLDLTSPDVQSTTSCSAADWHCVPALAGRLQATLLGPSQTTGGRITDVIGNDASAAHAPGFVSYDWTDPSSGLVVNVQGVPATGPLTPNANQTATSVHGVAAVMGTQPGSGVQWVEAGRRWLVVVSPDTTSTKTLSLAQSLVPYSP